MQTILIPIDFNIESLLTLKFAMNEYHQGKDKVNIMLLYGTRLSSSPIDLLFYSPEKIIRSHMTLLFEEGMAILKNRYEKWIHSLYIELFHGFCSHTFSEMVKNRKVTHIYLPKSYILKKNSSGFDLNSLIRKSGCDYQEIDWIPHSPESREYLLDALFY